MQLTDTQIDVFVAFKKLLAESQKKIGNLVVEYRLPLLHFLKHS